jgi:hypothetical protein
MRSGSGRRLAVRKESQAAGLSAQRASSAWPACAALLFFSACGSANQPATKLGPVAVGGDATSAAGSGTAPAGSNATPTNAAGTASAPVTSSSAAGANAGAAAGRSAAAGSSAGTGAAGSGTAGTNAADGGDTGGAAAGSSGSTGSGGVTLVDCKAEDGTTDPCGTYTTAAGTNTQGMKIQLGPLGGQMDPNVGKGFENTISKADMDRTPASCQSFVDLFMQDPKQSNLLLDVKDLDFALFSVYHPANWQAGKKYPIITWGNGTCAMPEGYGALLRYIASYGYVIFAANSRQVSDLSINPKPMVRALDFAFSANEDETSPYYHKLDTTQVAALGHSQGGAATIAAADDKRVTAAIIYNGGKSASKPFLTISGDRDIPGIGSGSAADLKPGVDAAPKAAFIFYHMVPMTGQYDGHLTLMLQPERVGEPSIKFLDLLLKQDGTAKAWFVGASCKLCNMAANLEFGEHGLD